jgi:hypothetical protein
VIFLHHHSKRDIALPLAEKPPEGGFSNMQADQQPQGQGQEGGGALGPPIGTDGAPGTDPSATASISAGANSRTPGSNSLAVLPCIFQHSLS